jgi:hypothetical protein
MRRRDAIGKAEERDEKTGESDVENLFWRHG